MGPRRRSRSCSSPRPRAWLASAAVAAAAGAGSALVGTADGLAVATAASVGIVARLSLAHPDTLYAPDVAWWRVGPWSAASTAVLLAVALLAVQPLPISAVERLRVGLLVLTAGYAMWLLGIAYARAKAADDSGPGSD